MKRAVVLVTLIALSELGAGTPAAAADRPGLTLSPTQGPQASLVQYRGSDFCAKTRCGPVTITFGDQVVASGVKVRSGGSFTGTFEVPPVPAGRHIVTARQPDAGRTAISQYFVAPNLLASPLPTPSASRTPGTGPASAGPPTGAPAVTAPSLPEPTTAGPATANRGSNSPATAAARSDSSSTGKGIGLWAPMTALLALLFLILAGSFLSRRLRRRHPRAGD